MATTVLTLAGVALGIGLGVYGRWAGWGFGLGRWGRPTPARVVGVRPLTGAQLTNAADWAQTEKAHRVAVDLEVHPAGRAPYRATAITWLAAGDHLGGRTVTGRVSRTRPGRVHLGRDPEPVAEADGRY